MGWLESSIIRLPLPRARRATRLGPCTPVIQPAPCPDQDSGAEGGQGERLEEGGRRGGIFCFAVDRCPSSLDEIAKQ
eukprot:1212025-Pyramimonas_sp.AAC.1